MRNQENINTENAVKYHYDKFPPATLNYRQLIPVVVKAADALARYDQMLKNMHNSEILLAPLRNQEAVISSRMEGTISTIDEILKYEADHENASVDHDETKSDVIETLLYRRALVTAQKSLEEGRALSSSLVRMLHQQLLSIGRGAQKSPGQYKSEQNYLGDKSKRHIEFIPISPEKLNEGLEKLFQYIESHEDPILIKTAISHLEFEALHPFMDGNGRIGRMLITLILWSNNVISAPHFYISAFFEEHKEEYIHIMREVSKTNEWTPWCTFFMEAVEKQAFRNLEVAEKIRNLYDEMKHIFSDVLSSKWCVNALDFVFTNPIFRNNKFTSQSGIPKPTAARFSKLLEEKNLISQLEAPSGRKPGLYSFEPLMEIVRV